MHCISLGACQTYASRAGSLLKHTALQVQARTLPQRRQAHLIVEHSDAPGLQDKLQRRQLPRCVGIVVSVLHQLQDKVGVLAVQLLQPPSCAVTLWVSF